VNSIDDRLSGFGLVLAWIGLSMATGLMWWAMVEYVFLPTLHMMGGMFRLFALR
jgi:hypothetical protein